MNSLGIANNNILFLLLAAYFPSSGSAAFARGAAAIANGQPRASTAVTAAPKLAFRTRPTKSIRTI